MTNLLTLTQYLNDGEYFIACSKILNVSLLSVLSDIGWIVTHTYMTYGVLSSGGTTLLYNGKLENRDLSVYSSVII